MSDFDDKLNRIPAALVAAGVFVPITITRETGTFDPTTLSRTSSTSTIAGHGCLKTVKTKASDGSLVATTAARLTVAPEIGDKLAITDKVFTVEGVSEVAPQGVTILWEAALS